MERFAMQQLVRWKTRKDRKPLIIRGARQTGKTWLLKEFGKTAFTNTVYINFENEPRLRDLFSENFDTKRIITTIELSYGKKINPADTLIIFDEIQAAEGGLTSLKYFCEDAPQYAIVAAGSLLGIAFHSGTSFPVGKVSFLDLAPLSFFEFLYAAKKEMLCDAIQEKQWKTLAPFHDELLNLLRTYMFVGGMPEVVQKWIDTDDYFEARETQREILRAYAADFSKHAPKEQVPRLNMVWDSLPAQLSKENKKFVYGIIREGARAKDFEIAIEWLCDCGLVLKSHRIKEPRMPLKAYQDQNVFKLFMLDVGLLGASVGLDARTLIDGNKIFTEFKGAMAEQLVMQELTCTNPDYLGYWTNERSTSEVDFVLQKNGAIVPIEVKSGENLSSRSFTLFCDKFKPDLAIKTSMLPFHDNENMLNVPLYGVATVETLTKSGKK